MNLFLISSYLIYLKLLSKTVFTLHSVYLNTVGTQHFNKAENIKSAKKHGPHLLHERDTNHKHTKESTLFHKGYV